MKTILALLLLCMPALAGDVATMVAWDASTEADLAGYRLHYGTAHGVYTQTVDVGAATSGTITLPAGTLVYCAVTAYNTTGEESGFSNELVFQSAVTGERKAPSAPKGLRVVNSVKVAIEQSSDLRNWVPIFVGTFAATGPQMNYRLVASIP